MAEFRTFFERFFAALEEYLDAKDFARLKQERVSQETRLSRREELEGELANAEILRDEKRKFVLEKIKDFDYLSSRVSTPTTKEKDDGSGKSEIVLKMNQNVYDEREYLRILVSLLMKGYQELMIDMRLTDHDAFLKSLERKTYEILDGYFMRPTEEVK